MGRTLSGLLGIWSEYAMIWSEYGRNRSEMVCLPRPGSISVGPQVTILGIRRTVSEYVWNGSGSEGISTQWVGLWSYWVGSGRNGSHSRGMGRNMVGMVRNLSGRFRIWSQIVGLLWKLIVIWSESASTCRNKGGIGRIRSERVGLWSECVVLWAECFGTGRPLVAIGETIVGLGGTVSVYCRNVSEPVRMVRTKG